MGRGEDGGRSCGRRLRTCRAICARSRMLHISSARSRARYQGTTSRARIRMSKPALGRDCSPPYGSHGITLPSEGEPPTASGMETAVNTSHGADRGKGASRSDLPERGAIIRLTGRDRPPDADRVQPTRAQLLPQQTMATQHSTFKRSPETLAFERFVLSVPCAQTFPPSKLSPSGRIPLMLVRPTRSVRVRP